MSDDTQARLTCLVHSIEDHFKSIALTEAFDKIVDAYFDEYADATEVDGETYRALEHLFEFCFWDGVTADDRTLEQVCGLEFLDEEDGD